MSKPTSEQIQKEIEALKACMLFVPERGPNGEDHHRAITAAVAVMTHILTVDMAYAIAGWVPPTYAERTRIEAALWLSGHQQQTLSSEFARLIVNRPRPAPVALQSNPRLRRFWSWRLRG